MATWISSNNDEYLKTDVIVVTIKPDYNKIEFNTSNPDKKGWFYWTRNLWEGTSISNTWVSDGKGATFGFVQFTNNQGPTVNELKQEFRLIGKPRKLVIDAQFLIAVWTVDRPSDIITQRVNFTYDVQTIDNEGYTTYTIRFWPQGNIIWTLSQRSSFRMAINKVWTTSIVEQTISQHNLITTQTTVLSNLEEQGEKQNTVKKGKLWYSLKKYLNKSLRK